MALTPEDVRNKQFSTAKRKSGYEMDEVDAFLDEIEEFCKNRALADAVLASADLIDKGNYGEVERLVREAILVGLQSDLGTDYFDDPRARLMKIKDNQGKLGVFWHTQGSGKSLTMVMLAKAIVREDLPDYKIVLVTDLCEGQSATVLQLPNAGRPVKEHGESEVAQNEPLIV